MLKVLSCTLYFLKFLSQALTTAVTLNCQCSHCVMVLSDRLSCLGMSECNFDGRERLIVSSCNNSHNNQEAILDDSLSHCFAKDRIEPGKTKNC